ncbi:unnamed protein product [Effrenium voratum]|nr:unnamed protein product [Effrenium voratum]CAJ1435543.1 unnamed protein product [Effrenium voratum]|mmetsp:Transcript_69625/g.166126  ORF Transcript_69625/g.166126 Transcript_69625/m.166126 type:complete len:1046 (-) Transcript_69625:74-3211(-)
MKSTERHGIDMSVPGQVPLPAEELHNASQSQEAHSTPRLLESELSPSEHALVHRTGAQATEDSRNSRQETSQTQAPPNSPSSPKSPRMDKVDSNVWGTARPPLMKDKPPGLTLGQSGVRGNSDDSRELDMVLSSELGPLNGWEYDVRWLCRTLCRDWRFQTLTTILTVSALLGDDARLLLTSKEADNFFNVLIVMAFIVFAVEIVAASLGIRGYFNSFFFYLDFIATATMLLDLTWFGETLYCKDHADLSRPVAQTSFEGLLASLTDTRASRTVRILRLVRLGKLYKFYQRSADPRAEPMSAIPASPGSPLACDSPQDWDLNSDPGKDDKAQEETGTRVGKKLSDMTSRRVIVLVLVMLFCSFFFTAESWGNEFMLSGELGAGLVYERFRSWCSTSDAGFPWCLRAVSPESAERREERAWYEQYMLTFIRSHLSGPFSWRLYWVGLGSDNMVRYNDSSEEFLGTLAQLNQARWLGATLPKDELWKWDRQYAGPEPIPAEVKRRLAEPWREQCMGFVGVPLSLDSDTHGLSVACSVTDQLRCNEVHYEIPMLTTAVEASNVNMLFVFDTRPLVQAAAGLSMLQTFFICAALAVGALSFAKDANRFLLGPLERILVKLEAIRKNPLHAMKLGDIEYREQEQEEDEGERRSCCKREASALETLETAILERTLIKLGGLLALGFGEAGAEIIVHNMQGGTSAELNAMVPGQEVEAVFGFCSIRNFGDATEVLKEKVMVFVNQVSEIVHGICDTYHGSPNKIIGGNSFLVVWRMRGKDPEVRTKMADMALMSFVCITIEVQKSNTLAVYRSHPGLQQRFPDFRVTLGFGLHCGWAIEGAIGSEYKIDASYLSPNVNVASQLEAASGQLGLWILLTNYMARLCSTGLLAYLRMVDHVMLEGSKKTLRLYTLDLDHRRVSVKPKLRGQKRKVQNRYKVRQMREAVKSELWTSDFNLLDTLSKHSDFVVMREPYSKEFFDRFAVGVRNYEAGEWLVARDLFLTCHYCEELCMSSDSQPVQPEDGPVQALLEFMKKYHFEAPAEWPGYRQLITN